MYANEPEMAKKWEKHTPKGKKLPEKVKKKKSKKKKSKKRTHKESFLGHLSAMLLTEETEKQLFEIEIFGFTVKPEFTHANSVQEAVTNIIAREFKQNNRMFRNRVYPTLDHLITAIIGPPTRRTWMNVQFKRVPKPASIGVDTAAVKVPGIEHCKKCNVASDIMHLSNGLCSGCWPG